MAAEGKDTCATKGGRIRAVRVFRPVRGCERKEVDLEGGDGGVARWNAGVGDHCVAEGDVVVRYGTKRSFHLIEMGRECFGG